MRTLLLVLACCLLPVLGKAQQDQADVKKPIELLFEGMRKADSAQVAGSFAPDAIMQTIVVGKDGKAAVRRESVSDFAASMKNVSPGAIDEQIVFETIKMDGDLALVWTPYRFLYNGTMLHSGVNCFTLVKINGEWKINYVIDTRRK
jgi:Putative lumazine-binding